MTVSPLYMDPEWCRARYCDDLMSIDEIASAIPCTHRTLRRWMDRHGIPRRSFKEARRAELLRRPRPRPAALTCACGQPKDRKAGTCIACRPYLTGPESPTWRGDEVGNRQAHLRLQSLRGKAAEHECSNCGKRADHWAYDHLDPNERPSDHGPYSLDPDRYMPLCALCHKRFDTAFRRQAAS